MTTRHRLACQRSGITTCGDLPTGVSGQNGPPDTSRVCPANRGVSAEQGKAARPLGDLFEVPLSPAQACAAVPAVRDALQPVTDALLAAARRYSANVDKTRMSAGGCGRW